MDKQEFQKILEDHKKWLQNGDGKRANLTRANLRGANLWEADLTEADLTGANLREANLTGANLRGAYLKEANLTRADLTEADLKGANLKGADLGGADLSGVVGLLSAIDYMKMTFEQSEYGYIVYKTFGLYQAPCLGWEIKEGSVITEIANPERTDDCGSGVNVAKLVWVKNELQKMGSKKPIWKCLIRWEWLPGVVVPYNTDGKIRCERVELICEVEAPDPVIRGEGYSGD